MVLVGEERRTLAAYFLTLTNTSTNKREQFGAIVCVLSLSFFFFKAQLVENRAHELAEEVLVRLGELPAAGIVISIEAVGPVWVHVRGHLLGLG